MSTIGLVARLLCRRSPNNFAASYLSTSSFIFGLPTKGGFNSKLVSCSQAVSCSLVLRKNLVLTSSIQSRVYGPEDLSERKDEVHHWTNERYLGLALVPLIPAALVYPNIVLDTALCSAMVLHIHWRLIGVIQDYIHGSAFNVFKYLIYVLSVCSLGSLCYFNYSDIGFARAVRLVFSQL